MVLSTAVLFYFIGSFVPYKAKASRARTAAEYHLAIMRGVSKVCFFVLLQRESAPSFVRI